MALATLMARIHLNGVEAAQRGLQQLRTGFHHAGEAAKTMGSHVTGAMRDITRGMVDAAGKATLLGGALGIMGGAAAYDAAVKLDSLTRSLASTSTGADDLRQQLARLREVAKLPGLGFEEAIQGSVKLQAAGLSAQLAERSLKAFGNALALAGGGKDQLDGTITALSQIQSKGKLSAEEINQLAERVPQIRQLMKDAFGTSETEAIQKMGLTAQESINRLVSAAERLPQATGGYQNAAENLSDAWKDAQINLGKGIAEMFSSISTQVEKMIAFVKNIGTQIGEVFAAIGKSGVLAEVIDSLGERISKQFTGGFQQGLVRFAATALSLIKNLPETIGQVGSYLSDLFKTIFGNIAKVASWAYESMKLIFGVDPSKAKAIGGFGAGQGDVRAYERISAGSNIVHGGVAGGVMGQAFIETLKNTSLGNAPMWRLMRALGGDSSALKISVGETGAKSLGLGDSNLKALLGVDLPKFPEMQGLLSFDDYLKGQNMKFVDPLGSVDDFTKRINASLGPLADIPSDLIYGGGKAGGSAGGDTGEDPIERLLLAIEKNTRQSADSLSLRAQTLGGGELAGLGVTPQELRSRSVSGFAPGKEDYLPSSSGFLIEDYLKRLSRAEQGKFSGRGRLL